MAKGRRLVTACRITTTLIEAALGILLPPRCPSCDQNISDHRLFCAECFTRVAFVTEPCCNRCGVMFGFVGQGGLERLCHSCQLKPPAFTRARAAFRYDPGTRRLILPFKHGDRTELAPILAAHMARAGAPLLKQADVLVPVPLHRRRLFQRRYNQAALLARALSRTSGIPVLLDGLVRRRPTPSLGHKAAADRRNALAGAFAVSSNRTGAIEGRRVVLIDDVMTSGATAHECAIALGAAGATDVSVLVAARVPGPGSP